MNDNSKIFGSAQEPLAPQVPPNSSASASAVARQRQAPSKRTRIVDFYNTTKSSYIPTLTNSITSFVGAREDENYVLPKNSRLAIYDTYAIRNSENDYVVNVYGHLYCPGTMNRKNRLLLTLARQLVKSSSSQVADQFQGELGDKLDNPDKYEGDAESVYSMESSSSSSISVDVDTTLRERLEGFMTRSLGNIGIKVVVGSVQKLPLEQLTQPEFVTDVNGHFKLELKTEYQPSVVQVSCPLNDEVVSFKEVNIIDNERGVSLICDIDDTVKLTGVVNDKRDMFRNVFVRGYKEIEIPGFVNWFTALKAKDCKIHYVSNSPWQLLTPIKTFFDTVGLPSDSIHLKQYSGNVISALMEPASERKKSTLMKIVSDFPKRSFILVGDTGEKDLEAYLSLAKAFPDQILKIYMRVVPRSLSDIDDRYVLSSVLKLVARRRAFLHQNDDMDLIDLESDFEAPPLGKSASIKKKLAPIIPKKPSSLKGHIIPRSAQSNTPEEAPPKLPVRRTQTFDTTADLQRRNPIAPHRAATEGDDPLDAVGESTVADSSHLAPNTIYDMTNVMTKLSDDDRRGDLWRERMIRVMNELPDSVDIVFFQDVEEILEESLALVNSYRK